MPRYGSVTFYSTTTALEVDTGVLFQQGGSVHRWGRDVKNELTEHVHGFAPPRHSEARHGTWARGHLQASIYGQLSVIEATRFIAIDVGARVPYAKYVHNGTGANGTRYIYTDRGWANKDVVDSWIRGRQFAASSDEAGMYMPITRIPFKTRYVLRVRGQKRNPFIQKAYYLTRLNHDSLPRLAGVNRLAELF